jgi:hypothetical protein
MALALSAAGIRLNRRVGSPPPDRPAGDDASGAGAQPPA